jgi:nitrous oxide reductase
MTRPRKANATSMQRRRFLQQGALAGAAALVAPGGTTDAQAPAAAPAQPAACITRISCFAW